MLNEKEGWFAVYARFARWYVNALLAISGISLMAIVGLVAVDVILRIFGQSLKGSVDLVSIFGALCIACAMPYTTAVKGHVAIELLFQKMSHRSQVIVDTLVRLVVIAMFVVLTWECIKYAGDLKAKEQVTSTLQIPVFWILYVFAFCSSSVVLVKIYHLLRPGKVMIKP